MKLTINGILEEVELEDNNILELLSIKEVKMPEAVSVEINGNIIKKNDFETHSMNEGDEIEFLYYMGGGM
jgi:sulfur carrier protein